MGGSVAGLSTAQCVISDSMYNMYVRTDTRSGLYPRYPVGYIPRVILYNSVFIVNAGAVACRHRSRSRVYILIVYNTGGYGYSSVHPDGGLGVS